MSESDAENSETSDFYISVELDKFQNEIFEKTIPAKRYVGSELYNFYRDLGLLADTHSVELDSIYNILVVVTLKYNQESCKFEIDKMSRVKSQQEFFQRFGELSDYELAYLNLQVEELAEIEM